MNNDQGQGHENQQSNNGSSHQAKFKGMSQPFDEGTVISSRQSASLIASTLVGVGVLTLPRVTAGEAQESAWLATLGGSILVIIAVMIITKLEMRFPKKNIVEYSRIILGGHGPISRKIGIVLSFPFIISLLLYWLLGTASVARTFGEVVVTAVLRETPLEVIIFTMLLTAFIIVMYDIEVLARVNEILLPIIVIPVLFIAFFSYQNFVLEHLLPIWPHLTIGAFIKGMIVTFFAFQGFEIITIFSKYTHVSKKNLKFNVIGIMIPSFTYVLIVIAGTSVFGSAELDILMWPTLELVKATQVPGLVLERMESAFLGVWVAAVFTTTANLYYAATIIVGQFIGKLQHRRWITLALLPLLYWISLLPQNVIELFEWQMYVGYIGFIGGTFLPMFLFVLALIRKKGEKSVPNHQTSNEDRKNGTISPSEKKGSESHSTQSGSKQQNPSNPQDDHEQDTNTEQHNPQQQHDQNQQNPNE